MTSVLSHPSPSQNLSMQHTAQGFQRACQPPQPTWLSSRLDAPHLRCPSSPNDHKGPDLLLAFSGGSTKGLGSSSAMRPIWCLTPASGLLTSSHASGFWRGIVLCVICPSPAGLYMEIPKAHRQIHYIGEAWAPSRRMFLRFLTCTWTHELNSPVWRLGKSYMNMHWYEAGSNMSFSCPHYALNHSVPEKWVG